jgi:O-glycosyl hydrolase
VQNPDGSSVLVLTNRGAEREVGCGLRDNTLQVSLPANSVTTLML